MAGQHNDVHAQERDTDFDEAASDVDSTFSETAPSLISLRYSIFDYEFENGRTYHSMSRGKYAYPNDDSIRQLEVERLKLQHHIWLITLNGELACNPEKHKAKRVMDMGTGTGVWAIDFVSEADAYPGSEASDCGITLVTWHDLYTNNYKVIGVDLSAIQPEYFEIDDLEKDWKWKRPFDFIFCRAMAGSFFDFPSIIRKAFDNLNPGGWFEMQDLELPMFCTDGTITTDSALWRWHAAVVEAARATGRPLDYAPKCIPDLQRAGFVDIRRRTARWPFNTWPQHPKLKEIGRWHCANLEMGLEGFSMALLTRVKGWDPAEVSALCDEAKKEVRNMNMHGYWNMYVPFHQFVAQAV
ncbi:Secondary metabolism regulator LAE1 [Colletotrichum siamense]|uniref:Secondary metabolism regulator LAE1 n=1 Tax=Colletotrichum siamense TaxID=690259 RepID=UPI001872589C|nr:Secondary metabolism regulator LAE1 [Colletotrichum siamense]KAF5505063.1 Secondary metabolism regulator LAE1 [Colletotrichum siamense]